MSFCLLTHVPMMSFLLGLLHQKEAQDQISPENPYIRFVEEIPFFGTTSTAGDEDNDNSDHDVPFRIAICMTKKSSSLLLHVQFLQCDIGFKRVIGFKEFELGGMEADSHRSMPFYCLPVFFQLIQSLLGYVYCRIYLNRQTAEAHEFVFKKIDDILEANTRHRLRWHHLHSSSLNLSNAVGVYQITVDQHGGQAKGTWQAVLHMWIENINYKHVGLGSYLRGVAQKQPLRSDLHEPHRLIQDLDEYNHLRRILRLCTAHFKHNIKQSAVPESVRMKMCSLVCMEHPNWDATIAAIETEGGKSGQGKSCILIH